MHIVNPLIGIIFFMASDEINSRLISLQSLGTIPLGKRFGVMRRQAKSQERRATILKTMSPDQSAKMKDALKKGGKGVWSIGKRLKNVTGILQYFVTNR
jgi:hypothetical protein